MDASRASHTPNQRRWLSFSLRTVAIVVAISAALFAIFASQIRALWNERHLPYRAIRTLDDLRSARDAQRSLIYCDVYWSIDAAVGRRTFHEFATAWQARMPGTPVRFYLLDLSDRDNVVVREAVKVWGVSVTDGSGELLWILDGEPQAYTQGTDDRSYSELAAIAQRTFGLPSIAAFPDGPPHTQKEEDIGYWTDWTELQANPSSGNESR